MGRHSQPAVGPGIIDTLQSDTFGRKSGSRNLEVVHMPVGKTMKDCRHKVGVFHSYHNYRPCWPLQCRVGTHLHGSAIGRCATHSLAIFRTLAHTKSFLRHYNKAKFSLIYHNGTLSRRVIHT